MMRGVTFDQSQQSGQVDQSERAGLFGGGALKRQAGEQDAAAVDSLEKF